MSPSQSAITQWGWCFHTLRGGIDPGDLHVRLRVVGVVNVWKDYNAGMRTYPHRGALTLMYDPQPISDRPVGLGFPHRAGRFRPGGSPFSPQVVGVVKVLKDF